ncbi:MAG: hypothetical protein ACRERC_23870, partial [Candidatus Binatia bacterium]
GRRARRALLLTWLPVPLLLLLLDVTFNLWFWHIPKLTGPSGDYGYELLLDSRALSAAPKGAGEVRVLALGSSIAGAFDAPQVEALLRAEGGAPATRVDRLLLPGIKPSDLRLFLATEGAALQPDVALVLLNPLDFMNPSFERDLKPQVRYVLPPSETLRERWEFISTVAGKLDLALASASNLYRYRKLLRASIEDHGALLLRALRGGPPAGPYGWYADGFTAQRFALPITGAAIDFEYFVDPAWLAQRGPVTLEFRTDAGLLAHQVEREPGWKTIRLAPPAGAGPLLHVWADSGWNRRAAGLADDTRLLGVGTRGLPAGAPPDAVRPPLQYPPLERSAPDMLLRMRGESGDAFAARWSALLEADTEFGRRFRAYRDAKVAARDTPVAPDGEFAELERLVELLRARGATVVLVNNPESPLMRSLYEDGVGYQSYVDALQAIAARHPGSEFRDLRAALPAEDFNDWHHVTYIGALKLGPVYAGLVRPLLRPEPSAAP